MKSAHLIYGSVYGTARDAAEQLQTQLQDKGIAVELIRSPEPGHLDRLKGALIIVTSTTGAGDVPDNLQPFLQWLDSCPNVYQKPFALAGIGDSSYFDTFCGAADHLQTALEDLGARPLIPSLRIDVLEHPDPALPLLEWAAALPEALRLSWQAA